MPAKGQTCQTCNGNCCIGTGYKKPYPTFKIKTGGNNYRHTTLLKLGFTEIIDRTQVPCPNFINGKCSNYLKRPTLCKSYYCHGKYWEPRV